MTTKKPKKKPTPKRTRARDTSTGYPVTPEYAKAHPGTTVVERVDEVAGSGYAIRRTSENGGGFVPRDSRPMGIHPTFPEVYKFKRDALSDSGPGETVEYAVLVVRKRGRR